MRKTLFISMISGASIMLSAYGAASEDSEEFSFPILNADGIKIGTIEIGAKSGGGFDIEVNVSSLTSGSHAMQFHAIGLRDAPDFKSSGGHYNPSNIPDGEHAGDMMNVDVSADGTTLIIHAAADDYTSQA